MPETITGTPLATAIDLSNQTMLDARIIEQRTRLQELLDKKKALDVQYVEDLRDNAQKMKDKEQSTENKLLGGLSIGTIGIGGMQMASGLAEQSADQASEEDMKAYLATFTCDFGQGRNIKGGERNIDLPGGNDLFAAANEYRALAADLKTRKEALGKQPGIESEVIIDAADTGLYDNVGLGRQSGAYTSLSRALTDETSKDAEEWAKQKADTASKKQTGTAMAVGGAVASIAANQIINGKDKENSDKITAQHAKDSAEIDAEIAEINANIANIEQSVAQIVAQNRAAIDEYNNRLNKLREILSKLQNSNLANQFGEFIIWAQNILNTPPPNQYSDPSALPNLSPMIGMEQILNNPSNENE